MELSDLVEIELIKQLKARYFYCVDYKKWDSLRNEVFSEDCEVLMAEVRPEPYHGPDELLRVFEAQLVNVKTIHHGHMPIIELTSSTTATGLWAMEDILFVPAGKWKGAGGRFHGYGHYHEEYVKGDGGWRIKRLELSRLHMGKLIE